MAGIQWFPGHMHAACKKILQALKNVDLVLEIVDARAPQASSNPMIAEFLATRQKPSLKLLNKSDLADPAHNQAWCSFLNAQPKTRALLINAHHKKDAQRVLKVAKSLVPHRATPLKPLRMMVLGVPNVGKSTFLNAFVQKKMAQTGDVPALTKALQRIDVSSSLVVLDTPGLMWHKIETESAGFCLALINTIGVHAFNVWETALFLADFLKKYHPNCLHQRYAFLPNITDSAECVLQNIAQERHIRQKGGGLDLEKAAHILLQDFRSGALGRMTLETLEKKQGCPWIF